MQFLHSDLGNLRSGQIVEVTLDTAANVHLMDSLNLSSFRDGRDCRAYGGHARRSPCQIPVPHSGRWHLTIDLGGRAGSIRHGIRVLG